MAISEVARGPSYSELAIDCKYNEDAAGVQDTHIELSVTDDSDQLENKYIETANWSLFIPLDHYSEVRQVVIQNRQAAILEYDYFDEITTDNIIGDIPTENEFIVICKPDMTAGIFLYDPIFTEGIEVHLTIYGAY
jgi:hypothetical protein